MAGDRVRGEAGPLRTGAGAPAGGRGVEKAPPGQPPWPALAIGPTLIGEPEPSVTGRVAAPGQARVTDFVSSGGVTTSPVRRTPEPPDVLSG